ncbi:putative F-box protein At3g10240 [Gossypium raimondii]|uniref:putative F-box protein At3g10240 n=1 Tax=Gossypium raimondii TaxID=29730 RepID=UPI00063A8A56|nr:putative F-box protein At3g10240 [Gossypium raimondii]
MQSRNEVADMVLMKILSKLASKSVIRFMNVCKSWRSSLGTPYFWTQHQHNGLKSNKLRLLIKCYHQNAHSKTTYFSGLSTEKSENFSVKRNIHIPYFENLKDQYSIHGQCNGLLCLHNHDDIAIWNPSTREITILPPPPMQLDPVYDVNLLNVGFDYKTNDYKVLRMFQKISPQKLLSTMLTFGDFDLHVLSLDLADEKFSTLLAPYHDCFLIHKWNFFDFSGSLGVIFRIDRRAKSNFESWVMKESWSKVLNIESIYGVDYPMGFWKNGGLFFSGSNNELLLFDPNVGEFEGLGPINGRPDMHGST